MRKKHSKRFQIILHAKVVIANETYKAVIGNVSEEGVSSTITTYINTDTKFIPHNKVGLNFDLPSGAPVTLDCEVRWFLKPSVKKESIILGLYIINPPSNYTDWISKFK